MLNTAQKQLALELRELVYDLPFFLKLEKAGRKQKKSKLTLDDILIYGGFRDVDLLDSVGTCQEFLRIPKNAKVNNITKRDKFVGSGSSRRLVTVTEYFYNYSNSRNPQLLTAMIRTYWPSLIKGKAYSNSDTYYADYTEALVLYIGYDALISGDINLILNDIYKGFKNQIDYCYKDSPLKKITLEEVKAQFEKDMHQFF